MPNFGEKPVVEKPQSEEDVVDTSWVELAGGKAGQVSQTETVQVAQVQAVNDEKKAVAVLNKLRSVPEAVVPKKDEAAINKERGQFDKEFQSRADERNKSGKWYDRFIGRKKVTAVDIAQEEALRMNKLIKPTGKDELVTGERDTLASKFVQRSEFGHKDAKTIEEEEIVRKHAPDLVKALEEGNFAQAKKAEEKLSRASFKNQEERSLAWGGVKKLLNQRVEALILSDDTQKMKELAREYSPSEIGLETLANMPKEIIRLPKIQENLSRNISGRIVNAGDPDGAKRVADHYVLLGFMTRGQADKIIADASASRR